MNISNNVFQNNIAFQSGSCIYISNENSSTLIYIISNNFSNNSITLKSEIIGSAIHLSNPSNILIIDNNFFYNKGRSGSCIFYEEINRDFKFVLENNLFFGNYAQLGGGSLYLSNSYDKISVLKNKYVENKAEYGDNFTTRPFRVNLYKLNDQRNFVDAHRLYSLQIIPGITNLKLKFHILDYYSQKILTLNGVAFLQIKYYKDFSDVDLIRDNIKIEGLMRASIQNGFDLINFKFYIYFRRIFIFKFDY